MSLDLLTRLDSTEGELAQGMGFNSIRFRTHANCETFDPIPALFRSGPGAFIKPCVRELNSNLQRIGFGPPRFGHLRCRGPRVTL